jgi:hypothetical protein
MIMVSGCQTCINCGYSPCRWLQSITE